MSNDTFAERLCIAMAKKKMTVKALAVTIGAGHTSVYHWTEGTYLPGLFYASKIADALGVSLDWLAGRDTNKRRTKT